MLTVHNLVKQYNKTPAVNNISFQVEDGEVAVLLGPNGAGKSTTMKCITGLLRYSGNITMDGYSNKSLEAKQIFGYIPETPALYEMLTVYEHLEFIARAYEIHDFEKTAQALLERFELWDKKDKLGKELSKGMQQKLSICCALLISPRVVFFDEPMVGLDPKAIKELKEVFNELKTQGCSVLISTHIIDSVEEVWDRVLIMKDGNIVLAATRRDMEAKGESLEKAFFAVTEG